MRQETIQVELEDDGTQKIKKHQREIQAAQCLKEDLENRTKNLTFDITYTGEYFVMKASPIRTYHYSLAPYGRAIAPLQELLEEQGTEEYEAFCKWLVMVTINHFAEATFLK